MTQPVVAYTAIFGNFDTPYLGVKSDIPHFCVTDDYDTPGDSNCIPLIMPPQGSPRRTSRYYKINSHLVFPGTEFTIWHGGNVQLLKSPEAIVEFLGDSDIAAIRHTQRTCAYDEAKVCIQWGKGNPDVIRKQMAEYRALGYPRHNGLHAAFLIVRRNNAVTRDFNTMWWREVSNGSVRDQLSFDYVLERMRSIVKLKDIPGDIYSGPYHRRYAIHKGEKS